MYTLMFFDLLGKHIWNMQTVHASKGTLYFIMSNYKNLKTKE